MYNVWESIGKQSKVGGLPRGMQLSGLAIPIVQIAEIRQSRFALKVAIGSSEYHLKVEKDKQSSTVGEGTF